METPAEFSEHFSSPVINTTEKRALSFWKEARPAIARTIGEPHSVSMLHALCSMLSALCAQHLSES